MNARRNVLVVALVPLMGCLARGAAEPGSAPLPVPISFARSAATIEARVGVVPDEPMPEAVFLRAFGRQMSQSTAVRDGSIRIRAPLVRVPTQFTIVSADEARREVGRMTAYPPKDLQWDTEVALHAAGTPKWFDQWSKAVGVPVRRADDGKLSNIRLEGKQAGTRRLLVVGTAGAGKDAEHVRALCRSNRVNVLVLDASWFGTGTPVRAIVTPQSLVRGLAGMRSQKWPVPPTFWVAARPASVVLNRWAWIEHERFVLVEEVPLPAPEQRLILNYVPWQQQLGQSEWADAALLEMLSAAARPIRPWLVHPPPSELLPADRPVLIAAMKACRQSAAPGPRAYVLDLRGSKAPPKHFATGLADLQAEVTPATPLLILGYDSMLQELAWAKLDPLTNSSGQPGVAWLPDDTLPSSPEFRVRLMQKLTLYGIPLTPPQTGDLR
ncbi:MAG: hypothetical protein HQ567_25490 [Candidatus Nealsonbacteria bacterium]|nr:hypothetical protein [Candidatus Nealsonbacteria bacterium]